MFANFTAKRCGLAALGIFGSYKLHSITSNMVGEGEKSYVFPKLVEGSKAAVKTLFERRFPNVISPKPAECEEEKKESDFKDFKLSKMKDKFKDWKKKREEAKIVRDEEYPNRIRIMMSEIMILRLKYQDDKFMIEKKEATKEALEAKKFQLKLSQCYGGLIHLLKGIAYDESQEKLKAIMESPDEELDHFFSNIKLFLEGAHKEFHRIVVSSPDEVPQKLFKQITYCDEDIYRFLSSLSQFYTEKELRGRIPIWEYFESHLKGYSEAEETSLQRSYALKYYYNKSERAKADADESYEPRFYEGPYIAPMNLEEGDFDILLLHGNASHPIKCWSTMESQDKTHPDIWIRDTLLKDLKKSGKKARIIHGTYETFQQVHEYTKKNIPELDLFELGEKVKTSLLKVGVGERPLIILSYSMGGILTKTFLNIAPEIAKETKGIIFFACPHIGSDVRDDTQDQLGEMISGMNRFINQNCIDDEEFVNTFLDNLKISKPATFLISPERRENLGVINDQFRKYGIESMSIVEGKKVYFEKTDHHYFVVKPESAFWPGSQRIEVKDKHHFQVTRMHTKEGEVDPTYQKILEFINKNLQ